MLLARLGRRRAPHPPAPDAPATPKAIPQAAPTSPAAAMSKNAPLWLAHRRSWRQRLKVKSPRLVPSHVVEHGHEKSGE